MSNEKEKKECCPKCVGAYHDADLDSAVCRNNHCVCHYEEPQVSPSPSEKWEQRFDKEIGMVAVQEADEQLSLGTHIVKDFIRSLLSSSRDEWIERLKKVPVYEVTDDVRKEDGELTEFFEVKVMRQDDIIQLLK